jgi:hypothetical protein
LLKRTVVDENNNRIQILIKEGQSLWINENIVQFVLDMPTGSTKALPIADSDLVDEEYKNMYKALTYRLSTTQRKTLLILLVLLLVLKNSLALKNRPTSLQNNILSLALKNRPTRLQMEEGSLANNLLKSPFVRLMPDLFSARKTLKHFFQNVMRMTSSLLLPRTCSPGYIWACC